MKKFIFSATVFLCLSADARRTYRPCRHCKPPIKGDIFSRMEKQVNLMTKKIDKIFSDGTQTQTNDSSKPHMKLKENKQNLKVLFPLGKGIDSFDAQMKEGRLSVKIPVLNLELFIEYDKASKYLSITTEWSARKADKKNDVKEEYAAQERMHHGQTVNGILEFKKVTVEYENGLLSVIIPKIEKKKKESKKIDVHIK